MDQAVDTVLVVDMVLVVLVVDMGVDPQAMGMETVNQVMVMDRPLTQVLQVEEDHPATLAQKFALVEHRGPETTYTMPQA